MTLKMKIAPPGTSVDDLELLTEAQVAKLLRVTCGHLRNSRVRGTLGLPYIKFGGAIRYRLRDVNQHLDDNTVLNTRHARGIRQPGPGFAGEQERMAVAPSAPALGQVSE